MTIIVETGVGVYGANSYVPSAFVTTYLTERGRETENSWSSATADEMDEACIQATDYIEKRFGQKFKGIPLVTFAATYAEGAVAFAGLPNDQDTLLLGDQTYTFVSTLSGEADEVLIAATAALTADNFASAVNGTAAGAGVAYGTGTTASRHSSATSAAGVVALVAAAPGPSGAYTALSGSPANVTLTAFSGGKSGGPQFLSFPRQSFFDSHGTLITGIPLALKQATAEYAVRAHAASLMDDPTTDAFGGPVLLRREKVGPIEEEYEYGGNNFLTKYPAADKLLRPLISSATGGVVRG